MKMTFESKDVCSIADAIGQLGITRMTMYRWIQKGKIQALSFGGYKAIPQSEIDRLRQ